MTQQRQDDREALKRKLARVTGTFHPGHPQSMHDDRICDAALIRDLLSRWDAAEAETVSRAYSADEIKAEFGPFPAESLRHREDCASLNPTHKAYSGGVVSRYFPCDCGAGGPVPSNHASASDDVMAWDGEERRKEPFERPAYDRPARRGVERCKAPAEPVREPQGSEGQTATAVPLSAYHEPWGPSEPIEYNAPAPPTGTLTAEMIQRGAAALRDNMHKKFGETVTDVWLAMEAARPKAGQAFVVTADLMAELQAGWYRDGYTNEGRNAFIARRLTELAAEHARPDEDLLTCVKIWRQSATDGKTRIAELEAELAALKATHQKSLQVGPFTEDYVAEIAADTAGGLTDETSARITAELNAKATAWATVKQNVTVGGEPSEAEVEAAVAKQSEWTYIDEDYEPLFRERIRSVLRAAYAVRPPAAIRQVTVEQWISSHMVYRVAEANSGTHYRANRPAAITATDHLNRMLAEPAVLATQGEQG